MKTLLAVMAAALIPPAAAQATIVNIDASVSGCDFAHCHGDHFGPGVVVDDIYSPSQLTLTAGAYTIRNATGLDGANLDFSAWNYNTSGANWLWAFIAIDHGTRAILVDSLPDAGISVVTTQAAAAAQAAAVNYVGHFTLTATTVVDFVTEDYIPRDNAGGVALSVTRDGASATPEPASWALMLLGFGGLGAALRRRGRRAEVVAAA